MDSITILEQEYHIGSRISIDSQLATVRFIGRIPQWPNNTAIGIEWDDEERGKNDGSLDGIRYFETHYGTKSGSFVKLDLKGKKLKKFNQIRSFFDALIYQYGSGVDFSDEPNDKEDKTGKRNQLLDKFHVDLGSKVMESYGFEKLARIQSDFKNLDAVSMPRLCIGDEFGISLEKLGELFGVNVTFAKFGIYHTQWQQVQ
ncbi:unnamed protein product [Ambrosiozyma monospora]|uniref:Unnamed protein product n=1 Tax=Ambrosiozyma monospora TaxID=43982 RepID=A0ACB5T8M7_AMBMO|nr:unnamed protein product [Ambrosiozyma monospora]